MALFAQFIQSETLMWLAILGGMVAIVFFTMVILLKANYKRCSSNQVLVIFGKTCERAGGQNGSRRGGVRLAADPGLQLPEPGADPDRDSAASALSMENIRVNVPSVFTVAIGTQPEVMQNAAIRLLGLTVVDIRKQAEEIIFGQLRQVIASMKIEDINRDREKFLQHIQNSLEPELKKIGLVLINVNITDIHDESGYIDAIGRKAASQAIQQARVDVAEQEKKGEIRVAEAEREKVVRWPTRRSCARSARARRPGNRRFASPSWTRSRRSASRRRRSSASVGEAGRAGEADRARRRKRQGGDRREVADAKVAAIAGRRCTSRRPRRTSAAKAASGRPRPRCMEIQNRAMAKAALAEAERVEAEQRAKFEAPAKAEKARIVVDAEAEAEKRRLEAQGEASAIFAKLEAEARGQYEILAKKGEGLKQIIEACGGAQQAFQLLMLEHMDKLAEASAKAISNIKFDKVVVWENGGADGRSNTADFLQNMARVDAADDAGDARHRWH